MSDYPQHDKAAARRDEFDTLTGFVDWLHEQGIHLAKWGEPYETSERCDLCLGTGVKLTRRDRQVRRELMSRGDLAEADALIAEKPRHHACAGTGRIYTQHTNPKKLVLIGEPYARLFARFADIDYQAFLDEKEQMVEDLQAQAAARA